MKIKYILLLAALTLSFIACEKQEPFDTQSEDDQPLILIPYETKTGTLSYTLANDSTPLIDSVIVTPSRYTTVNWIVDDSLVHTGTKIEMCFAAGEHALVIEAVTTKGKRTERKGTITVLGGAPDPNLLWEGPVDLDWNTDLVKVDKETMANVPVGSTIKIYLDVPEAEYHAMRITTPWWGDDPAKDDLVAQMDMVGAVGSFSFTYDDRCKALVEERGAMSVVGFGVTIEKIKFE